jgi:hypothetical protein
MLQGKIEREGEFSAIPRPLWFKARRMFCSVCSARYGSVKVCDGGFMTVRQCIDHIFARRFLEKRKLEAHNELNLLSVCGRCHGKKLRIETYLFGGDAASFFSGLKFIGYPMEKVMEAARFYGLKEFEKFVSSSRSSGFDLQGKKQ